MTVAILAFFRNRLARRGQVRASQLKEGDGQQSHSRSPFAGGGSQSPPVGLSRKTAARVIHLHCINAASCKREWQR
jgi:hypothetical protein